MAFDKRWLKAHTLGELKQMGYRPQSVKDELRENLIAALQKGQNVFEGVLGYEDTVVPDIQRAILARHNIILLGLRGQAKTRIARLMTGLLHEFIPAVEGAELHDDPFHPVSRMARDLVAERGDATPIIWIHRDERYTEKLATPDVTTADLIGDVDPIKAATLRLPYSDERVIHFGLVPHAHRGLFVVNELPDLQPRIQVALFNILQEGDIQIRGFKLRLPLDIQFIFTANPEDYTNRGSIVTPLKDRIESQILTHYPKTIDISKAITRQEAHLAEAQAALVHIHEHARELLEQVAERARKSELVDQRSGVSARLTISGFELLASAMERRALLNGESKAGVRITDLWNIVPAITGKMELVYEGEQEGPYLVALKLIQEAIKAQMLMHFPDPGRKRKKDEADPYGAILAWFSAGNTLDLLKDNPEQAHRKALDSVADLEALVKQYAKPANKDEGYYFRELVLYALGESGQLNQSILERGTRFNDFLSGMLDRELFGGDDGEEDED